MREIFVAVGDLLREGVPCALGTLVQSFGTSPSPIGTSILVDKDRRITGNIGAGCHESDIVEACLQTIVDGEFRLLPINLNSTDEITGGTSCGGALKVAVWRPAVSFEDEAAAIARGAEPITVQLAQGFTFTVPAKRRLTIVGATALAERIAYLARALDFYTIVIDPRPAFATPERLRDADKLVVDWPEESLPAELERSAAVLILSHDPKFDLPALAAALRSNVPFIGLLGSRRSQTARRDSLRELGFSDEDFARIHGPVGLDLGGSTNGETALSILAQVIATLNERDATPLDRTSGPIHSSHAEQQHRAAMRT